MKPIWKNIIPPKKLGEYFGNELKYFLEGGFWWFSGKIIILLTSLLVMIVCARMISKETFGAYQYINSIISILAVFSLPGLDTALVRIIARGSEKIFLPSAKAKLRWGFILTIFCFVFAGWYFLNQNRVFGFSFLIVGILYPFINAFNIFSAFWQGKKRFDIQAKYQVFLKILSSLTLIAAIFFFNDLISIIFIYSFSLLIFGALFFLLTLKKINKTTVQKVNNNEINEVISYGKHLTLISSIGYFSSNLDKIIIWRILGPISLAIYVFAQLPIQKIYEIMPIIPLTLPKLSEKNIKEIKKGLLKRFFKLFLIFIPIIIFLLFLIPTAYKIFFPRYSESAIYCQFLTVALIFAPFQLLSTSLLAAMKKKSLYIISFATSLLQIFLLLIFAPLWKIWGIILANFISQLLGNILTLYFFKKI